MSDLVGNPEDRFSCVAAHMVQYGISQLIRLAVYSRPTDCKVRNNCLTAKLFIYVLVFKFFCAVGALCMLSYF